MKTKRLCVESAVAALEALRGEIDDIVHEYEFGKDDPENEVEGWKPTDSARDFIRNIGSRSGLRMRLVNLAVRFEQHPES